MSPRILVAVVMAAALTLLGMPASSAPAIAEPVQTLKWTGTASMEAYGEAPTTALPGETKIIFENSRATQPLPSSMSHTLTFDTTVPGYNTDVNLNIFANPEDEKGGYYEAIVTLTPGKYRFHCVVNGHEKMTGDLIVFGDPVPDTTPPTVTSEVTGNKDTAGNYIDTATVKLTATDNTGGSGVDKVEYKLDDGAWTAYTAPVPVTAAGMHMFHYRAADKAGNVSPEGMEHFTVVGSDTTAPAVTAAVTGNQDGGGNYVGKATVTLTATDAGSGVAKVEYQLDGGPWLTYSAPLALTVAGAHTVNFKATDKAGNVSTEGTSAFTIVEGGDNTAPTTSIVVSGNLDGNWSYIGSATINLTATDAESGVDKIEYTLDGDVWTVYRAPVVVSGVGTHTVSYRASDKAGNVSAEQGGAFTIVAAPSGG